MPTISLLMINIILVHKNLIYKIIVLAILEVFLWILSLKKNLKIISQIQ